MNTKNNYPQNTKQASISSKIPSINGLRGIAIISVIYFHLFGSYTPVNFYHIATIDGLPVSPFTLLSNTWLGVNLFFILSGFVLYIPYLNNQRNFDTPKEIATFYHHRFLRLLPLFYISIFIALLTQSQPFKLVLPEILSLVSLTYSFNKEFFIPQLNPVLWSLQHEILFSLALPLIITTSKKFSFSKTLIFILLFSLIIRYIGISFKVFDINHPYLNILKDSFFGRLDDFVVGMTLAYIYINKPVNIFFRHTKTFFTIGIGLLLLVSQLWDYHVLKLLSIYFVPFLNTIFQIAVGFIILSLLNIKKGVIHFAVTNFLIQMLGLMCYSIYIWHLLLARKIINGDYTTLNLTAYTIILLVFSFLSYRFIEFGSKPDIKQLIPQID